MISSRYIADSSGFASGVLRVYLGFGIFVPQSGLFQGWLTAALQFIYIGLVNVDSGFV